VPVPAEAVQLFFSSLSATCDPASAQARRKKDPAGTPAKTTTVPLPTWPAASGPTSRRTVNRKASGPRTGTGDR
jgi:hypothetical protein